MVLCVQHGFVSLDALITLFCKGDNRIVWDVSRRREEGEFWRLAIPVGGGRLEALEQSKILLFPVLVV